MDTMKCVKTMNNGRLKCDILSAIFDGKFYDSLQSISLTSLPSSSPSSSIVFFYCTLFKIHRLSAFKWHSNKYMFISSLIKIDMLPHFASFPPVLFCLRSFSCSLLPIHTGHRIFFLDFLN